MGPAIAVAGLVWGLARSATGRVLAYAALAAVFAMVTPIVRIAPAVDVLPLWCQWYIRPFNEFTIFTLFPWAGFVFAGGAVGALIAAASQERAERRLHMILGAAGVALVVIGFYTAGRPSIYASSNFWTSSPTWFAIRLGILMIALTVIYGCEVVYAVLKRRATQETAAQGFSPAGVDVAPAFSLAVDPLAVMGRNSLFIYWIHVELVYGYASWGWRHRLPLWGTAIGYVLFCWLMYRAIGWRDVAVTKWRKRSSRAPQTTRAATA